MHQSIDELSSCIEIIIKLEPSSIDIRILLELLEGIFPFFYAIAVFISNISLVVGGIIFLLDSREDNGKEMVFRSIFVIFTFFFIFKGLSINNNMYIKEIDSIEIIGTFILLYVLFSFAALSLIMLIVNCGLYLIDPAPKNLRGIKKSAICIFAVLLPLGFNFPTLPNWR